MKNEDYSNIDRRIKLHVKAPLHEFKVGAHIGFESTLAKELSFLGIKELEAQNGAVYFKAKFESVWQIIALSRCARSFEMKIAEFHCENFGKLEHELESIPWELYLPQSCKINAKAICETSRLYHEGAIEERIDEAMSKCFEQSSDEVKLQVRFKNNVCYLWLDLCGEPLYKRGERWVEEAPVQETLAASILLRADFAKYENLIDPMAGSGVFSLEAAKWRSNSALKPAREFGFAKMPAFREAAFNNFLQKAKQPFALKDGEKFEISCSDKDSKAVKTIKHNLENYLSEGSMKVSISQADFFSLPPAQNALVVINPPYGKRIGKEKFLYREIARKVEKDFSKCKIAILCPPREMPAVEKAIGRSFEKTQTYNGGLRLVAVFA